MSFRNRLSAICLAFLLALAFCSCKGGGGSGGGDGGSSVISANVSDEISDVLSMTLEDVSPESMQALGLNPRTPGLSGDDGCGPDAPLGLDAKLSLARHKHHHHEDLIEHPALVALVILGAVHYIAPELMPDCVEITRDPACPINPLGAPNNSCETTIEIDQDCDLGLISDLLPFTAAGKLVSKATIVEPGTQGDILGGVWRWDITADDLTLTNRDWPFDTLTYNGSLSRTTDMDPAVEPYDVYQTWESPAADPMTVVTGCNDQLSSVGTRELWREKADLLVQEINSVVTVQDLDGVKPLQTFTRDARLEVLDILNVACINIDSYTLHNNGSADRYYWRKADLKAEKMLDGSLKVNGESTITVPNEPPNVVKSFVKLTDVMLPPLSKGPVSGSALVLLASGEQYHVAFLDECLLEWVNYGKGTSATVNYCERLKDSLCD